MIKKIFLSLMIIIGLFLIAGCHNANKVKVILPSGTPSLGLSSYIYHSDDKIDIIAGTDPLIAGFTNGNYDIIVAPVNLGAKLYNTMNNFGYQLYQPIVGCTYSLLSTEVINSIVDLDGKEIYLFGKNATPDVIFRSIINEYGINVTLNYVDDVTTCNAMLINNAARIILTSEPSKSKVNEGNNYYQFDLNQAWQEMAGSAFNIPQAGIFVKSTKKNDMRVAKTLLEMQESLRLTSDDYQKTADLAVLIDDNLKAIGVSILQAAIPNCHFISDKMSKEGIEYYFNKIIALNLAATLGGKLPNEEFYS